MADIASSGLKAWEGPNRPVMEQRTKGPMHFACNLTIFLIASPVTRIWYPNMIASLEHERGRSHVREDSSHVSSSSCTGSALQNSDGESNECTKSDQNDRTNTSCSGQSVSSSNSSKNSLLRNILRAETAAVLRSKTCFTLVLSLAVMLTGLFTYRYTTGVEQHKFENEVRTSVPDSRSAMSSK
jgi:hypothetical protein